MNQVTGPVRVERVRHTTHKPIERTGFVHYRPGCLCRECPNFLSCRLAVEPIAVVSRDEEVDEPKWVPVNSEATERVIKVLKEHPEGLTVRQLSIATGVSARHVYRIVKALRAQGVVKKLYELRREKIIDTRLRHYETTEIAHRYVLSGPETSRSADLSSLETRKVQGQHVISSEKVV